MSTIPFWQRSGLEISGEPDDDDRRSLAEVEAFARSDRYVKPTQETTELALWLHEKNYRLETVKAARWAMQEELRNQPERMGVILSESDFLGKLQGVLTVKVNDWSRRGMRGISGWKDGRWQYICAMQCGYMPEYSIMRFDEYDVPTNEEYRGWRTVLLRVITQDFATEEQVHRVFGAAEINSASRRYRQQLWNYRNRGTK